MKFVAKTLLGLEDVLFNELKALGAESVSKANRAVYFEGDIALLYKATYGLRTAIRVLKPFYKFSFKSKKDFFNKIYRHPWTEIFDVDQTFAIDCTVFSRFFNHSQYVAQFAKDGIVDHFSKKMNRRPNVELKFPDIRINLLIREDVAELALDASGFSLNKRSYRTETAFAPLNEVLAAGMIQLSEWDMRTPFIDPMTGSGTLPIEAAMLAKNIPAQYLNHKFAFQSWKDYEPDTFQKIKTEFKDNIKINPVKIVGSDSFFKAVRTAGKNALNIVTAKDIHFEKMDFMNYKNKSGFHLIVNPPYDMRIQQDKIENFYGEIGDKLKQSWSNSTAWILSGNIDAIKSIGLKTSKKIHLMNGQIPCKFHKFELYEGSRKRKRIV